MPSEATQGRGQVQMSIRVFKADGRIIEIPPEEIDVEVINLDPPEEE
jgi:hypothetical protein